MINREAKSTTMQPATLQGRGDPEGSAVFSNCAVEAETSREQLRQESEHHTQAVTVRVSARRTKMTTRWSTSMAGGQHRMSKVAEIQRPRGSVGLAVTLPSCPISNAAQNITFDMLEPHFERPLHQAADSFCVCTTLLKKICRRNGINNWPYRKICGLRKSIASMTKQVNYLDGDQRRAYAAQLLQLEYKLQEYLRTGSEPTEEFFQKLDAEAAVAEHLMKKTIETINEDEEKEVQVVPAWSTRLSLELPRTQIVHELTIRPLTANGNTWGEKDFRPRELLPEKAPAFLITATHHRALPSIASILQHQNYDSPSRAASTQRASTTAPDDRYYERDERQQPQWRYFPPSNDDAT
ncbi:hypothetical protein KXD40_007696 [Peronospora effusa]|uniref:RWP-RK domain-containing protein n=1 Tax=Peronospora effusa TaxID=542832 RepID=A0A3M6VAG6_9STRA|nr:hypothetical protein DD238_007442 [Peronospora effusa]RQM10059.1 hypothetical protein DD237_004368 [Peronospora effusa]UIZ23546.1 hypothetical protein KXD40_007696 [Peronospora effusa]CAI5707434.1 unnamed protein product [Peronospora effusa]